MVKQLGLNVGFAQQYLSATSDDRVWVKHSDEDTFDFVFNQSLSARDFRMISCRAWFQGCVNRDTYQGLALKFFLQGNILSMAFWMFATMRFGKHPSVFHYNDPHFRLVF